MAGRHDRAADPSAPGLLATGPVVIRGVSRSVRSALRSGQGSRHRAGGEEIDPVDLHEPVPAGHLVDNDAAAADAPLESAPDSAEVEGDDVAEERRPSDARDESPTSEPAASDGGGPDTGQDGSVGTRPLARDSTGLTGAKDGPVDGSDRKDADPLGGIAPEAAIEGDRRASTRSEPDESDASSSSSDVSPRLDESTVDGDLPAPSSSADAIGSTEEDGASSPGSVAIASSASGQSSGTGGRRRPLRERLGPVSVGVAVLLLLAVVCAALIAAVVVKTRNEAASAAREAAAYTPPPIATSSPAPTGPVIAIVSDESALRAAAGTTAADRWPQVLASRAGARVISFASAGSAYATAGADGDTFADLAATVPSSSDIVVFVGAAADSSDSALTIARAATQAFSAASKQAPKAEIVAVGPLYPPAGIDTADFAAARTAMQSAARIAGVRWVDPVASGWIDGVGSTSELTEADERTIAARMATLLRTRAG